MLISKHIFISALFTFKLPLCLESSEVEKRCLCRFMSKWMSGRMYERIIGWLKEWLGGCTTSWNFEGVRESYGRTASCTCRKHLLSECQHIGPAWKIIWYVCTSSSNWTLICVWAITIKFGIREFDMRYSCSFLMGSKKFQLDLRYSAQFVCKRYLFRLSSG